MTRRDANAGSSLVLYVSGLTSNSTHLHWTPFLPSYQTLVLSWDVTCAVLSGWNALPPNPHSVHPQVPSYRSDLRSDVCHLLRMPSLLHLLWSLLYSIMLFCVPKTYRFSLSYICLLPLNLKFHRIGDLDCVIPYFSPRASV